MRTTGWRWGRRSSATAISGSATPRSAGRAPCGSPWSPSPPPPCCPAGWRCWPGWSLYSALFLTNLLWTQSNFSHIFSPSKDHQTVYSESQVRGERWTFNIISTAILGGKVSFNINLPRKNKLTFSSLSFTTESELDLSLESKISFEFSDEQNKYGLPIIHLKWTFFPWGELDGTFSVWCSKVEKIFRKIYRNIPMYSLMFKGI